MTAAKLVTRDIYSCSNIYDSVTERMCVLHAVVAVHQKRGLSTVSVQQCVSVICSFIAHAMITQSREVAR